MGVGDKENIEIEEVEEIVDGQRCIIKRTISTKVHEEVIHVEEPLDETATGGQLVCNCTTPSGKKAYGLLTDNLDGTYTVDINASEPGVHTVDIELDGNKIPGSPFLVRIVQAADKKKVRIYGAGLNSDLLDNFKGLFHVDTKGAGPGDLKVRVHGPKKSFEVELSRDAENDRVIDVKYHPTESGIYTINVYWSGQHVSGSPTTLYVAKDAEHLDRWKSDPESVRIEEGLGNYDDAKLF